MTSSNTTTTCTLSQIIIVTSPISVTYACYHRTWFQGAPDRYSIHPSVESPKGKSVTSISRHWKPWSLQLQAIQAPWPIQQGGRRAGWGHTTCSNTKLRFWLCDNIRKKVQLRAEMAYLNSARDIDMLCMLMFIRRSSAAATSRRPCALPVAHAMSSIINFGEPQVGVSTRGRRDGVWRDYRVMRWNILSARAMFSPSRGWTFVMLNPYEVWRTSCACADARLSTHIHAFTIVHVHTYGMHKCTHI